MPSPEEYGVGISGPYGSTTVSTKGSGMGWMIIIALVALIVLCCCSISSSLSSGLGYKWMNPTPKA